MSESEAPVDRRAVLKDALLRLQEMQSRLDELEGASREPIAVVGMGCRFPGGAVDPESYWRLLRDGVDAIREVPAERWDLGELFDPDPKAPGKINTRFGGFLDDVAGFDAEFFGISPREAVKMDPQHRVLLEVAWEALEDAALSPESLERAPVGVFVGITGNDYFQLLNQVGPETIDAYHLTGGCLSFAAGRLAYFLGLQGVALAIDTACSSSLVAIHLACQSLRGRESRVALAGGVNLILAPSMSITATKARMLAPDGRCKTFDARADGFVRSEGCGVVVLKRLSDALAEGDRVLGVIRGSAVNQDGRTSGLTVPNKLAQEALIREALARATVAPAEVGYVEAHGTGTSLGDPIEVRALAAVLGEGRAAGEPFVLGSVKTNIGHLESAAGVAGLIKVLLALQHEEIPPHLHFQTPNPYVSWDEVPAVIPKALLPWPRGRRRVAGVSSFGASGTNAHLVVEEAPPAPLAPAAVDRPAHVLCLSAPSEDGLRALATRLDARLAQGDLDLADVCFTANTGRSHFAHRASLVAATTDQVRGQLGALSSRGEAPGLEVGTVAESGLRIAFLFTGQGAQYVGMGQKLYDTEPIFKKALDRCDEALRGVLERPLLRVLYPGEGEASLLDDTAYTQPALFALEYALSELWRSWGVLPQAVMGHSVGEYVAACVAGIFSLEDGLRLIAERGRLMQALPRDGSMAAVLAGEERVREALRRSGGRVSVAAVNGPDNVVVSGEKGAVDSLLAALAGDGVRSRPLVVSHAFHSPLMDPMLDAFESAASAVRYSDPRLDLVSNLTGRLAGAGEVSASYWRRHVREPVLFQQSMATLERAGYDVFVEIGPSPTLLGMGKRCGDEARGTWLPSLRKGRSDSQQILESLGALYVRGARIDWARVDPCSRRKVVLPTYPFQRERHWFESMGARRKSTGARARSSGGHALLGSRVRSATKERLFESIVSTDLLPFLAEHRVQGQAVVPATAYVEIAFAAARAAFGEASSTLRDLVIAEPLVLEAGKARMVQTTVTVDAAGRAAFQVLSQAEDADDESPWRLHARGEVAPAQAGAAETVLPKEPLRRQLEREVGLPAFYETLRARGVEFGPSFRGLEGLWLGEGEALGRVRVAATTSGADYLFHPAVLDACLQVAGTLLPGGESGAETFLPMAVDEVRLPGRPADLVWSHVRLRPAGSATGETASMDVRLLDDSGQILGEVKGLHLKRMAPGAIRSAERGLPDEWTYEVQWQSSNLPKAGDAVPAPDYLPGPAEVADLLAPRLSALGAEHGLDEYNHFLVEIESLSAAYVVAALARLGFAPEPQARFTSASLAERLGIVEAHRRLFGRFLEILVEDGALERSGESFTVIRALDPRPPQELKDRAARLLERHPDCDAQITLVRRCGEELAAAVHGDCDPLQLLFPGGSVALAEGLNQKTPFSRFHNQVIAEAVSEALRTLPPDRPLRVLEIGAGTGSTTSYVVPRLPRERTDYLFTDLSPLFTAKAAAKFREHPFVRFKVLDLEKDPAAQGLGSERFDLVLAANVIHATRDLGETLGHVRQLLAPRGLLIMLEVTERQRWVDVTFGLTDGWWRFTDLERRSSYPLLSHSGWRNVLAGAGFAETAMLPEGRDARYQQAVVMSRAPAEDAAAGSKGRWLVLADASGVAASLGAHLRERGDTFTLVRAGSALARDPDGGWMIDPAQPAHFHHLVAHALPPGDGPLGILHLWGLDATPPEDTTVATLENDGLKGTGALVHLVQAVAANGGSTPPRFWVVTRGAQSVVPGDPGTGLSQSPLWGLGKVVALEHPELKCVRVDMDGAAGGALALAREVLTVGSEDQVALRGNERYVARLVRRQPPVGARTPTAPAEEARRLEVSERGVLENLRLQPAARRAPGRGEVEIRVHATGLNFRDVLNALGMYPGDAGPLGGECAGRIVSVGEGVEGLGVGDEVVAIVPACFSTYVTASAQFVLPKPTSLGMEEGATLPSAFLTAHYALDHLGRMSPGDRVLIHAAAGGVGLAAVQLAQRKGALVFATAGSDAKRDYLRSLGVENVMSSRTLDFADLILERTGGRGVDIVLNSLSGDFIPRSLSVLAASGRFLEIGKRGIWSESQVRQFKAGVSYSHFDLLEVGQREPALIRGLLAEVLEEFRTGRLRPLPRRDFPLTESIAAFRYMAQARHIGKVVVTQREAAEARGTSKRVRPDGTYLITGGLGGLGLLVARFLVDNGARHLVLLGRSGASAAAEKAVAELEALGATVRVEKADVSSEGEVALVLERIHEKMPPLRGVFHAAGALDDGVLQQLDWMRFRRVMAAKVAGSWILHERTKNLPLDLFVLFSSAVSLVGRPGQGNHAAANAFLDTLAHYRRAQGLPGLSINWGAWGEVGAAVRGNLPERMTLQGIGSIPPAQGLQALGQLLEESPPQVAVFPVDWPRFLSQFAAGQAPPLLSLLAAEGRPVREMDTSVTEMDWIARLEALAPAKRANLLVAFVHGHAVKVLGLDPARAIDPRRPLNELGLDSLMAVELRNALGMALKRSLPATLLFDYPTLQALSGYLLRLLFPEEEAAVPVKEAPERTQAALDLQGISDEQAEALLLDELASSRNEGWK